MNFLRKHWPVILATLLIVAFIVLPALLPGWSTDVAHPQ